MRKIEQINIKIMRKITASFRVKRSEDEDRFVGSVVLVDTMHRLEYSVELGNPKNKKIEIKYSNGNECFEFNGFPLVELYNSFTDHQIAVFVVTLPHLYNATNSVKVLSHAKTQLLREKGGDNVCEYEKQLELKDEVYKLIFEAKIN
jgi:hypothetical protein